MIAVSWLDILAGAIAAAKTEGRDPTAAEIAAITLAAKGVESVLASTVESPGTDVPISFSVAQLGALALAAATGKVLTIRPSESMAESYSLTMPTDDGTAGQSLVTDGAGTLSWGSGSSGVTSITAGAGITCTPDPIVGAGTVAVDATVVLTSGSYANPAWVTSLASSKLTGALPAIDGSALTNMSAAQLTTGTLPDARLSTNIPTVGLSMAIAAHWLIQ